MFHQIDLKLQKIGHVISSPLYAAFYIKTFLLAYFVHPPSAEDCSSIIITVAKLRALLFPPHLVTPNVLHKTLGNSSVSRKMSAITVNPLFQNLNKIHSTPSIKTTLDRTHFSSSGGGYQHSYGGHS